MRKNRVLQYRQIAKWSTTPSTSRFLAILAIILSIAMSLPAQTPSYVTSFGVITNITSVPVPGSGHAYLHDLNETVNPANGALSVRIAATRPKERSLNFPIYAFMYDSTREQSIYMQQLNIPCAWEAYSDALVQNCVVSVQPPVMTTKDFMTRVTGSYPLVPDSSSFSVSSYAMLTGTDASQMAVCEAATNYVYEDFEGVDHPMGIVAVQQVDSPGLSNVSASDVCMKWFTIQEIPYGGDKQYKAIGNSYNIPANNRYIFADLHGNSGILNRYPGGPLNPTPINIEDPNGNNQNGTGRTGNYTGYGAYMLGTNPVQIPGTSAPYVYTSASVPLNYTIGYTDITTQGTGISQDWTCGSIPGKPSVLSAAYSNPNPPMEKVVTSIQLPDLLSYQFSYDPIFGLISKIVYPTGAWVEYTWDFNRNAETVGWVWPAPGTNQFVDMLYADAGTGPRISMNGTCLFHHDAPVITKRVVSYDGVNSAMEQDFSYSTTWDANPSFWDSKSTTVTTKDLLRPGTPSFKTVYSYIPRLVIPAFASHTVTSPMPIEDTIVDYDYSGKLLRTVKKVWAWNGSNEEQLVGQCTTLDNGSVSGTFYQYAKYSWAPTISGRDTGASMLTDVITDVAEYDYGTGVTSACTQPSTPPTKETVTLPAGFANTPIWPGFNEYSGLPMALSYTHAPQNMIDRPSVIKVYGSGVLLSETDYTYDESTPTAVASPIGHDEANYGPGSSYARGNLTTLRRKCFQGGTSCSDAVFHITYDTTGQPVSVQDANQNVTQISYADNYTSDDGTPSGNTNTYVTQLTRPSTNSVSHIQRFQWDFNKGELRVATDESGQKTMYFYNDPWSRLTETDFADQGKVTVSYSDAGPNPTVTTTQLVSLSPLVSKTSIAVMDGVGHVTQSQVTTDPQGTVYADTTYDGMGRAYTVSNPYRSKGESTYGVMTNTYDAFGRTTSLAMQDGVSTVGTSYVGNCSTVTDEDGRQRTSCSDALGRLTSVTEDPNGSNFQTLYKYDALNNLLCVEQDGNATSGTHCSAYPGAFSATNPYRVRQFFYNSLSRLMQSQNPEAGTINYYYDPNGNLISKADARGITISYSPIDALNRVTEKTYSDSTPSVTYVYDTATNGVGRLASDVTADSQGNAISSSYGYDVMGRPASATQCFGSNCATTSAVWNPSSTLLSLTYPSSRKLKYVYDGAARLSAVVFDTFDSNDVGYPYYAAVQSEGYWPSGLIKTAQFGNGLYEFTHQNVRLQPDGFTVSKSGVLACGSNSGNNLMQLWMNFADLKTNKNNGNVWQAVDYINSGFSQTYGYDNLNRITSAVTADGSTVDQVYTIDPWGNMQQSGPPNNFSIGQFLANNQIPSWTSCYDASGNLEDPVACLATHTYNYDAESRIAFTGGGTFYSYDGEGRRVAKSGSNGTIYFYFGGNPVAELNGSLWTDYVFAGGKRVAMSTSAGASDTTALSPAQNTQFFHGDHLGSARLMTDGTGASLGYTVYAPYGQLASGNVPSHYKFTGKERDAESGLDYFGARYYASTMGRFTSPDPMLIMRQKMTDPQQWNMYSYVRNNPLKMVDTNGKWPTDIHNQIIDRAFPGLSAHQRDILKSSSAGMDHCSTCQLESNSFQHSMRAPGQDPGQAKQQSADFIHTEEHLAQDVQATNGRNTNGNPTPSSTSDIKDGSLSLFGNAAHTVADGTSPAHVDAQGNPLPWNPLSPSGVEAHEAAESTITPEQMNNAVTALQGAFQTTYGQSAAQQAATPPPPQKDKQPQ